MTRSIHALAGLFLLSGGVLLAESPGTFQTPLTVELLDNEAFAEWVDGREKIIAPRPSDNPRDVQRVPTLGLWTQTTGTGLHAGLSFGDTAGLGARHLRIAFKAAIPAETVLTAGSVRVSVLKRDATYPGDMGDDSQWTAATRIADGVPVTVEPSSDESVAVWVLPAGTETRALRFTHEADPLDPSHAGRLGGAYVLATRCVSLTPQAQLFASSSGEKAELMADGLNNFYRVWANVENGSERPQTIQESPEWVLMVWPRPVTLRGLAFLFPGFDSAEIQIYQGDRKVHPREAGDDAWKAFDRIAGVECRYPLVLGPTFIDFGKDVTTRALRLRLTDVLRVHLHPHVEGRTQGEKRVWLGEWLALHALGSADLKTATLSPQEGVSKVRPPIAIDFTLPEAGLVTLVIENEEGMRVRNLISETPFPKGKNTVAWDGADDLGRDPDAASHGIYHIPIQFVKPGKYKVRGLWRKAIEPRYEFTVYNEGNPPWSTPDHLGGWLGNHSPPSAAVFLPPEKSPTGEPAVMLGCFVTEGPDGLAWVDLEGRKRGGKKWIGGAWTAAPYIARDAGPAAEPEVLAYVASTWSGSAPDLAELRLTALTKGEDREVGKIDLGKVAFEPWQAIAGLAVHNGLAAVSLAKLDELVFVDTRTKQRVGRHSLKAPGGLAFDATGNLLALTGTKLVSFGLITDPSKLSAPKEVIADRLENPRAVAFDSTGNILVSDRGTSHQVKVFSAAGKFLRSIGKPGTPAAGPYDPLRMNSPAGLTVDSLNQLWVTEDDFLPKRVSVWTLEGEFVRAIYGPSKYGGGGSLDPRDKTRFYYADEKRGTLQFNLDWEKGTSALASIPYRPGEKEMVLANDTAAPETALYHDGRRYFTSCYNSSPTNGSDVAFLFIERNGIAIPAAAMGRAGSWDLLKTDAFRTAWPEGVNLQSKVPQEIERDQLFFIWSDNNDDGHAQPEEVVFRRGRAGGVTVMEDLAFAVARLDAKAMRFEPSGFTASGVPLYEFPKGEVLAEGVLDPASTGGSQFLAHPGGRGVLTLGVAPFSAYSLSGVQNGKPWWSYPSLWPGLHASHSAPEPERPGEIIGTTRLLGGFFTPKNSDAGPMWAVNSNHGLVYLFTDDGLFVATLFKDMRQGARWIMPAIPRETNVGELSLGDENFWPTISQTSDGTVFLLDGNRNSLLRLEGLETIRRLPDVNLTITEKNLRAAQTDLLEREKRDQADRGRGVLDVSLRRAAPAMDGSLADWTNAAWVDIDRRGTNAYFNSDSKPYNVTGSVAVAGDRLYAALRTGDPRLLENSGAMAFAPFKTGGALDLVIATDPEADTNRTVPAPGDIRLLVTMVKGKPLALLYRARVVGTKDADKVPFSSPWRTITFDRVDDVSGVIEFAGADGNYEFSIPLAELGLKPKAGLILRGDIGILRGNGTETTSRVYWSNKATGITADVPSEAALTPSLWGRWQFVPEPVPSP